MNRLRGKLTPGVLVKLALMVALMGAAAVVFLAGVDIRALFDAVMVEVRAAGPLMFFTAMAVLPAFGFPVSVFTLTAGAAFGIPLSIVASLVSLAVNISLTYWMAARLLRPIVEWMIRWFGYNVPRIREENHVRVAFLIRIAPGPPFFLQGYLLGLARVRFGVYFVVSLGVSMVFTTGMIVFGESLYQGKFGLAILSMSFLVVLGVVVQLIRRRMSEKRDARSEERGASSE